MWRGVGGGGGGGGRIDRIGEGTNACLSSNKRIGHRLYKRGGGGEAARTLPSVLVRRKGRRRRVLRHRVGNEKMRKSGVGGWRVRAEEGGRGRVGGGGGK